MWFRALACLGLTLVVSGCNRPRASPKPGVQAPQRMPVQTKAAPELQAELHLPALLVGQKAPLLIMLHGLGGSAEQLEAGSDWLDFANQHGIAWLAPNGPFDKQGRRFWDSGPSCCNFDRLPVDHVAALAALIGSALTTPGVDPSRVFVGGHSNGAFMAHRLACARPDLVSGIIAIAGTGPLDPSICKAPGNLRVLQIHGDADPIVPYAGGHLFQSVALPEFLSPTKTASNWAGLLGCNPSPLALAPLDLEASLPGAETRVQTYPSCKAGKVELWTVAGGGHNVGFRSPAPAAVWAFLSQ